MAKSTRLSEKKVWVGLRGKSGGSLIVQGFEDFLVSEDGKNFTVAQSAETRAQAFLHAAPEAVMLGPFKTAEQAIESATKKGI